MQPLALISFIQVLAMLKVIRIICLQLMLSMHVLSNNIWYKGFSSSTSISIYMWIINEIQLLLFDVGIKPSPMSEGVMEIQIVYNLAREKPDNAAYTLSPGPYVWLPFAKPIWVQNCSSTFKMISWFHSVCRPCCRPGLPHSPSNNHHRVVVMVWLSSYKSY
jgi:hypothetical protein